MKLPSPKELLAKLNSALMGSKSKQIELSGLATAEAERMERERVIVESFHGRRSHLDGMKQKLSEADGYFDEQRLQSQYDDVCRKCGTLVASGQPIAELFLTQLINTSVLLKNRDAILAGGRAEIANIEAQLQGYIKENKKVLAAYDVEL